MSLQQRRDDVPDLPWLKVEATTIGRKYGQKGHQPSIARSQDNALAAAATALQAVVTNRDNAGSTGENEKRRSAPQEAS